MKLQFFSIFCNTFLIILSHHFHLGQSASHIIFNSEAGKTEALDDSPYLIQQPHSLHDFLNQIEWVEELSELKMYLKKEQVLIEKQYNKDDPEIEQKLRENDEDCVRSKSMELETEQFLTDYPFHLLRVDRDHLFAEVQEQKPNLNIIDDVFLIFIQKIQQQENVPLLEPECSVVSEEMHINSDKENGHEYLKLYQTLDIESFPNVLEPNLTKMTDRQLKSLSYVLAKRLDSPDQEVRWMGLYFSHFYWRMRGKTRNALQCLLKYLRIRPKNIPAIFQLGVLLAKLASYEQSIQLLKFVNRETKDCGVCLMPLGDVYVLSGNFEAAIKTFDQAYALDKNLELGLKKASLLRCINKIFKVMEDQHSNLLHTIKDVEMFNKKVRRIQELEMLIEENRAPAEARVQAKLAYEHFEYGPLPSANCREGTQWVNGGRERKRLYCTVSSWTKYNETLMQRKRERAAQREKERKNDPKTAKLEKQRLEEKQREAEEAEEWESNRRELELYLQRVAPFVGMAVDEPQLRPKYPLENKPTVPFFHPTWPSLEECRRAFDMAEFDAGDEQTLPQFFISPRNKGYLVSDLLTKYLALGPEEMIPLPWELPICSPYAPVDGGELAEKFKFILELDTFKRIKSGQVSPHVKWAEKELKLELYKLVDYEPEEKQIHTKQPPLISEIGQRIGNLMHFGIGPKWLSFNLAALYFRHFGIPAEALNCLELALKFSNYEDIALTQLAQILMRTMSPEERKNQKEMDGIEQILRISIKTGGDIEPVPHHIMAIVNSIQERWAMVERSLLKALEIEPEFGPSKRALLSRKCIKRMAQLNRKLSEVHAPVCCWPNEQEIFCFVEWTKLTKRRRTRCFRLEALLEPPFTIRPVHFRCNTPYTGRSYPLPAFAKLLLPLLRPAAVLRAIKEEQFIKKLELELTAKWKANEAPEVPVFPLDYGGFSEERIRAHQRPLWPEGVTREQMHQDLDFPIPEEGDYEEAEEISLGSASVALPTEEEHPTINTIELTQTITSTTTTTPQPTTTTTAPMTTTTTEEILTTTAAIDHSDIISLDTPPTSPPLIVTDEHIVDIGVTPKVIEGMTRRRKPRPKIKIDGIQLGSLQARVEVVHKFDIPLPAENLPVPPREMVDKGRRHAIFPKNKKFSEFCAAYKKSSQLLDQPISTWVSPTAKGVLIEEMIDLSFQVPDIANLEPECHEPALVLEESSILLDLDDLPAYLYRHHLTKFYKPEKALRDTFRSIDTTQFDKIEHVAARLFFAIRGANSADQVHWALSTLASLYWRVKGDPVNAIKCLRHSLFNSPEKFKDVPLVSLANIYHQAGFLHSALFTLGKALETGRDVVAVHFTLANVYSTIGDYHHALQFYHSTLALQSSFEPAKIRIASIHCLTNGALLEK